MGLTYDSISDVTLGDNQKISIQSLNRIYRMLVQNDIGNLPSQSLVPGIWEKTWINDNTRPGYKKGQAVWINTEDPDEFIQARNQQFYDYLINNEQYRDTVLEHSGDQAALNSFYREILDAGELYYVGDIKKPVQLRVCTADEDEQGNGVKHLPTDDDYWEDFFQLRDDKALSEQILAQFESTTAEQFETHQEEYHPETQLSGGFSEYMLNDFSNVETFQFHNRFNITRMEGFDQVVKFVRKRYGGKSVKWFRLWKSGYLEQGGVFDSQNLAWNDSVSYGGLKGKVATVTFDWKYGDGNVAPYFDYTKSDVRSFYESDSTLKTDVSSTMTYDKSDNLSPELRYVVSLSPILGSSEEGPYDRRDSEYDYYVSREVTGMKNKSFCFVISPGYDAYSYYAYGFTISQAR